MLRFDLEEGTVQPFLKINDGLTAITYDAETKLVFTTDIRQNQVHFIDLATEKVLESVDVGSYPTELATADGKLFVLNSDSSTVSVIDIQSAKSINTFPVVDRPSGLYIDEKKALDRWARLLW